ncbi:hypothetical protein [Candidatus Thalassolituus haligoni]|uniref:hypothetical protein n=1 Tax=Candidatus Thalassolituus haligoni TaxID=3100113 RepID=UPI003512F187|tara:strand:- start:138 stop:635 length:498 start_codon:yes stop_codon:yes gene_type:complete
MHPHLQVKSTNNDAFLESIISVIESVDCKEYFSNHLGKSQSDQKVIVAGFQSAICDALAANIPSTKWELEYRPSKSSRDSVDIFGSDEYSVIAIELDKHRADQVAKKFVSRVAILPETKVYYISLCYPGTANMSKPEVIKYFGFCSNLAKRMDNVYAGFTVESKT